jgi:flagellar hook-basal body complex protein FliE
MAKNRQDVDKSKAMINNQISQVLEQMRSIESLAKNQGIGLKSSQPEASGGQKFADMMQQAIDQVNQNQAAAGELGRRLEMGDPNVDLAQVMVAMQKSRVSFQALAEVRNKLLTAYQDVMNMPV